MIYQLESEQITCEIFSKAGLSINSINDMVTEIQNRSKFRWENNISLMTVKALKNQSPLL